MNIAEIIGWVVIGVLGLGIATLAGIAFFELILLVLEYLEEHFKFLRQTNKGQDEYPFDKY